MFSRLQALHARPGPLLCGGAWDAGTARLLAHLGYEALETSSAGLAFSLGRPDGAGLLSREEILDSAAAIAAAVTVPVTADLENGFGDDPATVAETIALAASRGIAGGSIEDTTGRPADPLHPHDLAVERVRAAAEAARGRFLLTARCDAYMHGRGDLAEVIRRLQAYQEAGADVLAAPGLPDRAAVESVVRSLDRPVVMFAGLGQWRPALAELGAIGVKRVSPGSGLARVAMTAFLAAARDIARDGDFGRVYQAEPFGQLNTLFQTIQPT